MDYLKKQSKIVVLKMITTLFDVNKQYTEEQVKEILKPVYDDFVLLKRYIVDCHFLCCEKDGNCYFVNNGL